MRDGRKPRPDSQHRPHVWPARTFDSFRSDPRPATLERVHLLPPAGELAGYRAAAGAGRAIAEGVATARDFANTPPNRATPAWIADSARKMAREHGLGVRVLTPSHLERRGMNAILAVGGGSANPPRLVRLEWGRGSHRVTLVGKGITSETERIPNQHLVGFRTCWK